MGDDQGVGHLIVAHITYTMHSACFEFWIGGTESTTMSSLVSEHRLI